MKTQKDNRAETKAVSRQGQPFRALQNRDFRLLWLGQSVSQIGTMMRLSAIGWQIYLLTHDPLQLGIIGLCRVIPLVACSLLGGSAADAVDRRRLLIAAESLLLVCSAALALVTLTGIVTVWWIYGIIAISSAINAFERPAFSALVPALIPREQLPGAISLNTLNFQVATVIGPGLGGVMIAVLGVAGVYWLDAISYAVVLFSLVYIHYRPVARSGNRISIQAAIDGLRFVWSNKILVSGMLLDFFATFFGSATTLLPVFASDVLKTNAVGFGMLSAAQAIGAVATSLIMAWVNVSRTRHPGLVLLVAVFFYSLFTVLFGFSSWLWLSLIWLALIGASDTISMVLRQTIAQLVTPDEMRGRMQSVNMIFFAGGPQLGEVEAGVVARLAGAPFSVVSGGVACLLLVLVVSGFSQRLRHYEFEKY